MMLLLHLSFDDLGMKRVSKKENSTKQLGIGSDRGVMVLLLLILVLVLLQESIYYGTVCSNADRKIASVFQ